MVTVYCMFTVIIRDYNNESFMREKRTANNISQLL